MLYTRQNLKTLKHAPAHADALADSIVPAQRTNFGAIVLDDRGRVVSCSDEAGRMFGGHPADVEGAMISAFIPSLMPSNSSPSYNVRYLAHLSSVCHWQMFEAVDIHGRHFDVEIAMSRVDAEPAYLKLLNLRLVATA